MLLTSDGVRLDHEFIYRFFFGVGFDEYHPALPSLRALDCDVARDEQMLQKDC